MDRSGSTDCSMKRPTLPEEFILLTLDDEKGVFHDIPPLAIDYGAIGAVLMDLALQNRIDSDLEKITIVDPSPTGDPLYDDILTLFTHDSRSHSPKYWIKELANRLQDLRQRLLIRLVDKGILKKEKHRFLWVFSHTCYPMIDETCERTVIKRIREIVLSEEIPDPRDVVLIALVHSCDLIDRLFQPDEREAAYQRIEQISKMDLIGQALNNTITELNRLIVDAVTSVTVTAAPIRV